MCFKDRFEYEPGTCMVCHENTDVRWKNLYVIGSEGLSVCHKCEMKIVRHVEFMMREAASERKAAYLRKKSIREGKPHWQVFSSDDNHNPA